MIDIHEEAERILMLVKQLKENSANEELQMQVIENALKRAYLDGQLEATKEAKNDVNEWMNRNDR